MLQAFMERMRHTADAPPLSFESFFDAERTRLVRAVYLLTGNAGEAEEIVQDAFVAVWERWDRVATAASPVGYLYRTAMNRHRTARRRAMRRVRVAIGFAEGGDLFAAVDERDSLARALTTLTMRRRQALVLTELLGFDSVEAGRAMNVSDSTVRRLASEARAQLRRDLGGEPDG
jgi:RNA polymerase sigma factor (sigma-70 family)